VRIGLNSGDVVVGKIGDDLRMDYTAQGHTVGLAQRMEQLAEPGRVYVTEHTARLVAGYVRLDELGTFDVKGMRDPVRVFELVGLGRLRTRFDLSRSRGLSRFVGRRSELATLEQALERAIAGEGQVVAVVGEAGSGKSRLCFELVELARTRGVPVREAHCVSHGRMIPFLPVRELLRAYFDVTERDPARIARNKIAGALVMLDRSLEGALPVVFDFLGVVDGGEPPPTVAADSRQRQLLTVAARLIEGTSAETPGIVLVEDLHWIDGGSEVFLHAAVEVVSRTRTLLLLNFRPEYQAAWTERAHCHQVDLHPLPPEAIDALLVDLLGTDASLGELPERIRARTGGNPSFVEEVVRSLVEGGSLVGPRGELRLGRPVEHIAIPDTVHAVLAARIDRLGPREKHVLQTASVVGKSFSEQILAEVAELPERDLERVLHALTASEFLDLEASFPAAEYVFKHPVTREVAYGTQLAEHRARRHAMAALAVSTRWADRLEEHAALIAHHWEEAEEPSLAARWHRRAAEREGMSHAAESLGHWRKVRGLAQQAPPSRETDELGALARAQILAFGARAGAPGEDVEALFREGRELAERSGNDVALALPHGGYGSYLYLTNGVWDVAATHLEESVRIADTVGQRAVRVLSRFNLTHAAALGGRFERAIEASDEGLALCGDDWDVGARIIGYSTRVGLILYRCLALAWAGRVAECAPLLDTLMAFARERDDRFVDTLAHLAAVNVAEVAGDGHAAVAHGRRALDSAEHVGLVGLRIIGHLGLGRGLLTAGEWADAHAAFEGGLALIEASGIYRLAECEMRVGLARARRGLGDLVGAQAAAARAARIGKRSTWHGEMHARLTLAGILAEAEGAAAADAVAIALERVALLVERTGARAVEPMLHEELARLARLRGDEAAALAWLESSRRGRDAIGLRRAGSR
jgi:adenylate cyclase